MSEITLSIIQKVKSLLDINEDISTTELYNLLYDYRINLHPDKYLDEVEKEKAEEKFKEINVLLKELETYIQNEKLQKKPAELIPYRESYDNVILKQRNIFLEAKVDELRTSIISRDFQIEQLEKEINSLSQTNLETKTDELIKLYKPTKRSLISMGIIFILTILGGILTKVDEIARLIYGYAPFSEMLLNKILFTILVVILLLYAKQIYQQRKIENIASKIKTRNFIQGFISYMEINNFGNEFTETIVCQYLNGRLVPKSPILNMIFSKLIPIYTVTTIESLKDIFLYHLLTKKLIYIHSAKMLDRTFRIYNYQSIKWDDQNISF